MIDLYQIVTDKIIAQLEKGCIPWKQTWRSEAPKNFVTGNPYRGINVLLLGMQNYTSSYWLTFNQCRDLKGYVKKGEKSSMIVFWKPLIGIKGQGKGSGESSAENELAVSNGMMLRYYLVFNLDQVELPEEQMKKRDVKTNSNSEILEAETIISEYRNPPVIETIAAIPNPRYIPSKDLVQIQPIHNFNTADDYYASLFHELVHSTGAKKRLNRAGVTNPVKFGSEIYGKEELIAEMGASFLCAISGINSSIDLHASYIKSWLEVLRNDKKMVICAAGQAQKAVDRITGKVMEESLAA